jgi:phosphoglycolate phosphatase
MPYKRERPRAVLFDWDNTLVNTMPLICAAINQTLTYFGHAPWSDDEIKRKTQLSAKDGLPGHFGDQWQEAMGVLRTFYQQSQDLGLLAPLEGALELLERLASLGIPMALVSNKDGDILRSEVAYLKWGAFFPVCVGSGDADKAKPDPDLAYLALKTLQIPPSSDIWFVGDSLVDWQCAEAAGCWPIPIGFGHEEATRYRQAVQNCWDLEKILSKM